MTKPQTELTVVHYSQFKQRVWNVHTLLWCMCETFYKTRARPLL